MVRVLVCGDMMDRIPQLLPRLQSVLKQNATFKFLLLTTPAGKLPTPAPMPPIPMYFAALSHGGSSRPRRIGPNLHYVGATALLTLSNLTIAFAATGAPLSAMQGLFARVDYAADILLTPVSPSVPGLYGTHVRHIGISLRPRYHFTSADAFEANMPFRTYGATHASRVIELPPMGKDRRALHALDVMPLPDMSEAVRAATLEDANGDVLYNGTGKKRLHADMAGCVSPDSVTKWRREDACWFCLGDQMQAHLLIHRGVNVIVALTRGGLDDSHMVILPIAHVAKSTVLCDESVKEVATVMAAIARMYEQQYAGKVPYFFERCGETNGGMVRHMHIQVVALRKEVGPKLEANFVDLARQFGVQARFVKQADQTCCKALMDVRCLQLHEYFWAQVGQLAHVVVPFGPQKLLPVHFGRTVVANAMTMADRADWRACVRSEEDETRIAMSLKAKLTPLIEGV